MTEVNFVSKVLKSIAITFRLIDKTIQPFYVVRVIIEEEYERNNAKPSG